MKNWACSHDSDLFDRASQQAYVVVGHPEKGLVGLGRGRGHSHAAAQDDGFQKGRLPPFTNVWTLTNIINLDKAVLNMDYVNRYEERTLWGEGKDLRGKWGAAKVHLRARPPGDYLCWSVLLEHMR